MRKQNFRDKGSMRQLFIQCATGIFARFLVITLAPLLLAARSASAGRDFARRADAFFSR